MATLPNPQEAQAFFSNKMKFTTGPVELNSRIHRHEDINIIDVRMPDDFQKGHIPGAINFPRDQWENTDVLSKDKLNIFCCYSLVCHLAADAASIFSAKGYPVMEVEGGFKSWQEHGLEIEK